MSGKEFLWRKQVLAFETIKIDEREVTFDSDYVAALAVAFGDRALDFVPVQLALAGRATSDPEQSCGYVTGLEVVPDGLDALVALSGRGDALIRLDRHAGVAAQVIEGYRRTDGMEFPAVLRMISITDRPLFTNLRPWVPA